MACPTTSCTSEEAILLLGDAGIRRDVAIELLAAVSDAACQARTRTVTLNLALARGQFSVGYTVGAGWWYREEAR